MCGADELANLRRCLDLVLHAAPVHDQVEHVAPCLDVRHEEVGDRLWRTGRAPPLEPLEGHPVERFHRRRHVGTRRLRIVVDADPHVQRVQPRRLGAATVGRGQLHRVERGGIARRGHPDAEPPVAEPTGPPDRGVRAPTDDDGDRLQGWWCDLRLLQAEVHPVEVERTPAEQRTDDVDGLVHSSTARRWIDAAVLHFVPILAADSDAEHEPTRCQQSEVGELSGDDDGVAQRQ